MVSILDQKFQDAEQRFLEVMYGTKKVKDEVPDLFFFFKKHCDPTWHAWIKGVGLSGDKSNPLYMFDLQADSHPDNVFLVSVSALSLFYDRLG